MRNHIQVATLLTLTALLLAVAPQITSAAERSPNFIIIFCDDLGYGDIGCFGSEKHRTPNIDRMAKEGLRMTSFYSTCGVCTPSRSSLMTGCYPRRVNMHQSARGEWVLFPVARRGLNPKEITIAEVLKAQGYATACVGKWHLGDQPPFLPTQQGFDSYFGIPYSNDMGSRQRKINPPLPILRDTTVIEAPADQTTLTKRYTEEVVKFIAANKDKPFFVYLPHTMPHNPVNSSPAFKGKSANRGYGDCVEEIDWSTGQILAALKQHGIDEQTLVIFTSDNGAAKRWGGSNKPLSGFKGSTMEGGMREPCVIRWPGKIPAGSVCDEVASTIDLLPTFAKLAGTTAPTDRKIDGRDIWPLLSGEKNAKSPHEAFYYYFRDQLQAVRAGKWKLHLPRRRGNRKTVRLYDLDTDIGEANNVATANPDVVKRLGALADLARADLGDGKTAGNHQRPAGHVKNPQPLTK
ncbi:MAG: sulfatase [Planctomycetes bacterium]|nr:sulfatase [Planctomycetota bacterium]